ncbi:L,D-transpeptidase [Leifsonia sp. NPDC014704]|uniref:L,D-transpeptidase n=1 Tax=Leifsonia sp. NPDC014704 TaxID=3364123 RepID=UPI0036F4AB71
MTNRRILPALLCTATLLATLSACAPDDAKPARSASPQPTASADPGPALPPGLSPSELHALPTASFDAVIPGLIAASEKAEIRNAFRLAFDIAAYGADFRTPVALIPANNFLGEPTVVVRVNTRGDWSLILTPARKQLPSKATADDPAPAQSAAWVPTRLLRVSATLAKRVVISTSKQTLSVVDGSGRSLQEFPVGVGTDSTPTPTGTGYLQARYLDPAQGQEEHRIQLTSLHATAADEPYDGSDGGLIGIHYQSTAAGAVSHGCVRLSAEAIAAVDALPLGTPVQITG